MRAELHYRLRPAPGSREVPVEVLPLAGASVAAPTAFVWEDPVRLDLETSASGLLVGTVPLPAESREGDVVNLRVRYRVRAPEAGTGRGSGFGASPGGSVRTARVPLVIVPWPPAEPVPETFTARVVLPAGAELEPGFPAAWTKDAAAGDGRPESSRYRTDLPVLPSFVSFTVRDGGADGSPGLALWALLLASVAAVGALALRFRRGHRRAVGMESGG